MIVAIIDYGSGNVFSVSSALKRLGVEAIITSDATIIKSADAVIFPGVGHAKSAMEQLKVKGLDKLIPTLEQPFLGICLGMQLMCSYTEEGDVDCLDIFSGVKVKKFIDSPKIPHMGWNTLINGKSIFHEDNSDVYFVHSYFVALNEFTISETEYGSKFTASMKKNNFYGCQFHPEKSGEAGGKMIAKFLGLVSNKIKK